MGYLKKLLHDVTVCEVGRMTNWEQAVQNRQKKWENDEVGSKCNSVPKRVGC